VSLAENIRAIERRFASARIGLATSLLSTNHGQGVSTGWPQVDNAIGGGLSFGLHEWFGVSAATADEPNPRHWTPPLCLLVHLAWQAIEANPHPFSVVWIGGRCFPHPAVLVRRHGEDRRLLTRSVFVAPRDLPRRLWAVDLAIRSPVVGVVVADGEALDMPATRRIQLVAKEHNTLVLVVRPPIEQAKLSAAQSRWVVRRQPQIGRAHV